MRRSNEAVLGLEGGLTYVNKSSLFFFGGLGGCFLLFFLGYGERKVLEVDLSKKAKPVVG